jgi:hypothetical protein
MVLVATDLVRVRYSMRANDILSQQVPITESVISRQVPVIESVELTVISATEFVRVRYSMGSMVYAVYDVDGMISVKKRYILTAVFHVKYLLRWWPIWGGAD